MKTVPDSFIAQTVKKRGWIVQWFLVDGKLRLQGVSNWQKAQFHKFDKFPIWSNAAIGMISLTEFPLPKDTSLIGSCCTLQ